MKSIKKWLSRRNFNIRQSYEMGVTVRELAREYEMTTQNVYLILGATPAKGKARSLKSGHPRPLKHGK